ncbi:MAG: amidohydrolase family protein [Bacteroidia bacterium]|jgi:beta-aspartyl-dipeptidase (metallo-type)
MFTLIKNANVYAPHSVGQVDLLIAFGRILEIGANLDSYRSKSFVWDAEGRITTPGLIDQHIHLAGAGGNSGFSSLTTEVHVQDLLRCGTTTAVGLMGTDGVLRSLTGLYAKVMALREQGLSTYMYSGYYGIDSLTLTGSVQTDMLLIEPVLGCKIAISDVRSSVPTPLELARLLRQIKLGGATALKKGIMHVHLGILPDQLNPLFELVDQFHFPIEHITPTHTNRNEALFAESIRFAKAGGCIDITTGASRFEAPFRSVIRAWESGVAENKVTMSSDGHAGLSQAVAQVHGGQSRAPIAQNLHEMTRLVMEGDIPLERALLPVTLNPANNLGLKHKGRIAEGCDADLCIFDDQLHIEAVVAMGKIYIDGKSVGQNSHLN